MGNLAAQGEVHVSGGDQPMTIKRFVFATEGQEQAMANVMHKGVAVLVVGLMCWCMAAEADAQYPPYQLNLFYYYPYHYYPHNYWPTLGPRWPEPPGANYQKPPAYMAYPPFREPNWRYELWMPQKYHRGSHFWLDQF